MSTGTRTRILDCSLAILRTGGTVTLESAAREAGLTKPGLMYYFPNKQALMLGLVDHVVDRWERLLVERLGTSVDVATPAEKIRAYLDFALTTTFDETDIVMLSDPRLRDPLSSRWTTQMAGWVDLPEGLSADERARLTAVRLLADGAWFASATKVFVPSTEDLDRIRTIALGLLEVNR